MQRVDRGKGNIRPNVFAAIRLHVQNAAAHGNVAHALTDLAEILPSVVVDLGEHLHEEFPHGGLLVERDGSDGAQRGLEDSQPIGLDSPAADIQTLGILLDEHLDAAVRNLHAVAFVGREDVARQLAGVVDGAGREGLGIANHESVAREALRDLVELEDGFDFLVGRVQVLVGFLDGLAWFALLGRQGLGLTLCGLGGLGGLGGLLRRGRRVGLRCVHDFGLRHRGGLVDGAIAQDYLSAVLQLGLLAGKFVVQAVGVSLGRRDLARGRVRGLVGRLGNRCVLADLFGDGLVRSDQIIQGLELLERLPVAVLLLGVKLFRKRGNGALGNNLGGVLWLSLDFRRLLQHGDEEATSVLQMRVDADAPVEGQVGIVATGREHAFGHSAQASDTFLLSLLLDLLPVLPDTALTVHDGPGLHSRHPLQTRQLVAAVDDLHVGRATAAVNGGGNHGLVLDRVHTAGRVDDPSTDLEHLQRTHENSDLRGMQTNGIVGGPVPPDANVLARSSITSARNICQNAVELQVSVLGGLSLRGRKGRQLDRGVHGCIVVRNDQVGRAESLHLVDQHVGALVVGVVGNQQTSASAIVVQTLRAQGLGTRIALLHLLGHIQHGLLLSGVQQLHELRGFAAGGCAHVQHGHARSDVNQEGRDHADDFLTTDVAHVGLGDEEFLERCERSEAADDVLGGGHPPGKLVGVPRDRARGLDRVALVGNGGDLGNEVVLELLLDSQGVSSEYKH